MGDLTPQEFYLGHRVIPDSFVKTNSLWTSKNRPYASACVKFILLTYLHRYFNRKFTVAPRNEIFMIDAFAHCKNSNRNAFLRL